MTVRLVVNGERVKLEVPPTTRLIDVLRDHLGLTGTKEACGRGDCGACTVLVGDRAVPSCLVLSARVTEPVRTVEGIAPEASALREALADLGGLQCGYCTPGIVVRAHQLIAGIDRDNPVDVRHALGGNFCRCTGYNGGVAAIDQVGATVAARDSTGQHPRDGDR